MRLVPKIILPTLAVIALPVVMILIVLFTAGQRFAQQQITALEGQAAGLQDKINRNLFERYGDVQAFSYNTSVHRALHELTEADRAQLTGVINSYVKGYGCYALSLVTSPDGVVEAVNTVKGDGSPLPQAATLIGKNLSTTTWFERLRREQYSTADGLLTGTVMEGPEQDPVIKELYGDRAPLWTVTFSAPIIDQAGTLRGYWHNCFASDVIEQMASETYRDLAQSGLSSATISVINAAGKVLIDVDPSAHDGSLATHAEDAFTVDLSAPKYRSTLSALALDPKEPATGHTIERDPWKSEVQKRDVMAIGVYARSQPVLGYIGLGTVTVIKADRSQFFSLISGLNRNVLIAGLIAGLIGAAVMYVLVRKIIASLGLLRHGLQALAQGELAHSVAVASADELGQMATVFNESLVSLRAAIGKETIDWPGVGQQRLATERLQAMVENAPINIMMGDREGKILYVNPASVKTLTLIEAHLPSKGGDWVGKSIAMFYKDPAQQLKLISDPRNLPMKTQVQVGPEQLSVSISAILDGAGTYIGPMVTWTIISERIKIFNALKETSATLAAAAAELSSSSQQMAIAVEQTTRQSEGVASATELADRNAQEVANATSAMTAAIGDIARNMQNANLMTGDAVTKAEVASTIIAKLGESSQRIGTVVKLITSIAQQTNLLALNATIEAARAGEAGKGFAVVANEVKELAKQTAKATDEISAQITAIQSDTNTTVESIAAVTKIIQQTNAISITVASATEEQSVTTAEITRNVQQVASGTKDIASNILGVTEAAKANADIAVSLQESANGLSKLANDLQDLLKQFEV